MQIIRAEKGNERRELKPSLFNVTWLRSVFRGVQNSEDAECRIEYNFEGQFPPLGVGNKAVSTFLFFRACYTLRPHHSLLSHYHHNIL